MTCNSSPEPPKREVYDDVPGATPNWSAYCHLRNIEALAVTATADATLMKVLETLVVRVYVVPPSKETRSPIYKLETGEPVTVTEVLLVPSEVTIVPLVAVTFDEKACAEEHIETRKVLPKAPAYFAINGPVFISGISVVPLLVRLA